MSSHELMPGRVWCPQAGHAEQRGAAGEGPLWTASSVHLDFIKKARSNNIVCRVRSIQYDLQIDIQRRHVYIESKHVEHSNIIHNMSNMYTHQHHWSDLSTQYVDPGVLRLARDSSGFPARGDATRGLPLAEKVAFHNIYLKVKKDRPSNLKTLKVCIWLHWGRDCPGVAEIVKTEPRSQMTWPLTKWQWQYQYEWQLIYTHYWFCVCCGY